MVYRIGMKIISYINNLRVTIRNQLWNNVEIKTQNYVWDSIVRDVRIKTDETVGSNVMLDVRNRLFSPRHEMK